MKIAFTSILLFFLFLSLPVWGSYIKSASATSNQAPQNLIGNKSVEPIKNIISPEQEILSSPASPAGRPIRLEIPEINVESAVKNVGLTSLGAMDAPKGPDNTVWFELGPHPGESGSAVIAGHYGRWKDGSGSVFDNLYKLKPGDKLNITDDQGAVISFVVREARSYAPNADAPEVFSSNDGKSHLNLITCEGTWDKTAKSYSKRLVVFADKE